MAKSAAKRGPREAPPGPGRARAKRGAAPQLALWTPSSGDSAPPAETPPPRRASGRAVRSAAPLAGARDAQDLAARQRSISVSEFFVKNRHLLGFDNPSKALLTAVKEAVDNSLDACEEAGILPELRVEIQATGEERYRVAVEDNGPGIVKAQVPRVFGELLYGSKFHVLRQARGQQGIGISAAGMYAQLTTGKPTIILSRPGKGKPAHRYEVTVDTRKNTPIAKDELVDWDAPHGTRVEFEIQAVYKRGRRSVDDYVEQTALLNPHARIHYAAPGTEPVHYERLSDTLPPPAQEIRPHPHGVELGALIRMLGETRARTLGQFLSSEFSRVSPRMAEEIAGRAKLAHGTHPGRFGRDAAERLHAAVAQTKILAPPTNCLSPLGEETLLAGLKRRSAKAEFFTAVSRPPSVYRGNPFLVEAALAWGDPELASDEPVTLLRFANRVPLLYQQGACATAKSVMGLSWKSYGLQHPRGALPLGPMVVVVHIASVWVPFTSESKEAIAHYPEILREVTLALQGCGRHLGHHISRRRKVAEEERKRGYLDKYLPHIGIALKEMLSLSATQEAEVVERLRLTLDKTRGD